MSSPSEKKVKSQLAVRKQYHGLPRSQGDNTVRLTKTRSNKALVRAHECLMRRSSSNRFKGIIQMPSEPTLTKYESFLNLVEQSEIQNYPLCVPENHSDINPYNDQTTVEQDPILEAAGDPLQVQTNSKMLLLSGAGSGLHNYAQTTTHQQSQSQQYLLGANRSSCSRGRRILLKSSSNKSAAPHSYEMSQLEHRSTQLLESKGVQKSLKRLVETNRKNQKRECLLQKRLQRAIESLESENLQ